MSNKAKLVIAGEKLTMRKNKKINPGPMPSKSTFQVVLLGGPLDGARYYNPIPKGGICRHEINKSRWTRDKKGNLKEIPSWHETIPVRVCSGDSVTYKFNQKRK